MSRRSWLFTALAVLPLAACTAPVPSGPATPALKLVAFDSCAQLEKELRAAAEKSYVAPPPVPGNARALGAESARAAELPGFSGTNVHEAGVDEPDIVKTDGRRIVTISGGVLRVVDTTTRRQTGRLDLGLRAYGEPKLLLSGDHVLVLADGGGPMLREDSRIMRPHSGRSEVLLVDLSSGT